MRSLWLHLRSSPIRYAVPVLVVLYLAMLFGRSRHWIGVWPETGAAAQIPPQVIGALVAGVAAFAASAPTRHRLGEQLMAARVHPAHAEAFRLGASGLLLLVPYLVGQATAFTITAATFPPGVHLWAGYALLGLCVMLLAIAVGWSCGKLLGSVFGALTAAAGFLFLAALLDAGGVLVVSGPPERTVAPLPLALLLISAATVLATVPWLGGPGVSRRGWRPWLLIPAALPFVVVAVTVDPVVEREPAGDRVTCVEGPTRLCIWPEHEKYLPELRALSTRLAELPDPFVLPARMNEYGIERIDYTDSDGLIHAYEGTLPHFYILEGSSWSFAGAISRAVLDSTFGFQDFDACSWSERTEEDQMRLSTVDAWLEAYLAGMGSPDYQTNAPEEIQRAWAVGHEIALGDSVPDQFRWAAGEVDALRDRYCQPNH